MQENILIDDFKVRDPELKRLICSGFTDDAALRRWIELTLYNELAYVDFDGFFEMVPTWAIPDDPNIYIPEGWGE